jgi:tRNA U34 5-methylaminomethyl-2-thiouridine-forming methyltransferase MnmC
MTNVECRMSNEEASLPKFSEARDQSFRGASARGSGASVPDAFSPARPAENWRQILASLRAARIQSGGTAAANSCQMLRNAS